MRILGNAGFSLVENLKPAGHLQTGIFKDAWKGFADRKLRRFVSVARKGSGTSAMRSGEGSFAIGMAEARLQPVGDRAAHTGSTAQAIE